MTNIGHKCYMTTNKPSRGYTDYIISFSPFCCFYVRCNVTRICHGLLHWHWGNRPAYINKTQQSTTKPCAYLSYIPHMSKESMKNSWIILQLWFKHVFKNVGDLTIRDLTITSCSIDMRSWAETKWTWVISPHYAFIVCQTILNRVHVEGRMCGYKYAFTKKGIIL